MSEKTLRVVYDYRIRFPIHTTSLLLGVAKIPQSSNNYADQFSDTSGESHRQRPSAPESNFLLNGFAFMLLISSRNHQCPYCSNRLYKQQLISQAFQRFVSYLEKI